MPVDAILTKPPFDLVPSCQVSRFQRLHLCHLSITCV